MIALFADQARERDGDSRLDAAAINNGRRDLQSSRRRLP